MPSKILAVAVVVLMVAGFVRAQQAAPVDRFKPIAPFVNLRTTCVGYVDAAKIDPDGAGNWLLQTADKLLPVEIRQDAQGPIRLAMTLVRQYKKELVDAGAPCAYWVLDDETMHRAPGYVVIPAGKNAEALSEKIQALLGQAAIVWTIKDAVIVGGQQVAADLGEPASADRPDVAAAFAASEAPVILVSTLTDDLRKEMTQHVPTLPSQLGGGSAVPLIEGYQWAMIELRMPREISGRMVVQMKDKPSAEAMVAFFGKYLEMAKTEMARERVDLAPMVQILAPRLETQRMIVEVKTEQVPQLVTTVVPALMRAREHAKEVMSMSNMRQLLMGVVMYANEHRNAYPDKLEDVAKYMGGPQMIQRLMTNPVRPQQQPGYVYIKPKTEAGKPVANASETAILYETFDKWPGAVSMGFADGHVEQVRDEATFKKMLGDGK